MSEGQREPLPADGGFDATRLHFGSGPGNDALCEKSVHPQGRQEPYTREVLPFAAANNQCEECMRLFRVRYYVPDIAKYTVAPANSMEKRYAASIEALCLFLSEVAPLREGWRYYIHLWAAPECGIRIDEYGTSSGTAGSCFMREDHTNASARAILAAENFLLWHSLETYKAQRDEGLERAKEHLREIWRP